MMLAKWHSRAPHHCPHKTPHELERQAVQLRRQLPTFGAARLRREFQLAPSHKVIQRIGRAHGWIHERRRKVSKETRPPWQIIERLAPRSPLDPCLLPVNLVTFSTHRGIRSTVPSLGQARNLPRRKGR